jgi:hypothetical protein
MVRAGPRSATTAVCFECTTDEEREIAAGEMMVGRFGRRRVMQPWVRGLTLTNSPTMSAPGGRRHANAGDEGRAAHYVFPPMVIGAGHPMYER